MARDWHLIWSPFSIVTRRGEGGSPYGVGDRGRIAGFDARHDAGAAEAIRGRWTSSASSAAGCTTWRNTQRARPEELRPPRTRSSTTSAQGERTGGSGGTVAGRARRQHATARRPWRMRERGWHLGRFSEIRDRRLERVWVSATKRSDRRRGNESGDSGCGLALGVGGCISAAPWACFRRVLVKRRARWRRGTSRRSWS